MGCIGAQTGLAIGSHSEDNAIYNNAFQSNTINIYDSTAGTSNKYFRPLPIGGNYFSNWIIPDNDGDGFVDKPYGY